ncbi:hypothetical protein PSPO01_09029 [Paraphaeosphaeria sporulosa]
MIIHAPSVPTIIGVLSFLLFLNVAGVFLRFYARRGLGQRLQVDDWLMIPAIIGTFGCAACLFHGIRRGSMGYRFMPIVDPSADASTLESRSDPYARDWVIVETRLLESSFFNILQPTLGLIKLAVVLFYRRLFVVQKHFGDARNLVISGMATLVVLWTLGYTFAKLFQCGSHSFERRPFYDFDYSTAVCVDTLMLGYSFAITDFLMDCLIALIPIPLIWKLHLPIGQRLAVMAIFAVGSISIAASGVRLAVSVWIQHVGVDPEFDEELNLTAELFWGLIELTTALLACCLPTLRALVKVPFVSSTIRSLQSFLSIGSKSQTSSMDAPKSPSLLQFDSAVSEKGSGYIVKQSGVTVHSSRADSVQHCLSQSVEAPGEGSRYLIGQRWACEKLTPEWKIWMGVEEQDEVLLSGPGRLGKGWVWDDNEADESEDCHRDIQCVDPVTEDRERNGREDRAVPTGPESEEEYWEYEEEEIEDEDLAEEVAWLTVVHQLGRIAAHGEDLS